MGTLKGFPYPPAMVRAEQSSAAPHARMGTPNNLINPPAIFAGGKAVRSPHE